MKNCDITIKLIDENEIIGDSLNTINDNFSTLDNITCTVKNRTASVSSGGVYSTLTGQVTGGITVSPTSGIVNVSEIYCPLWHIGNNNKQLYKETAPDNVSQQVKNSNNFLRYVQSVVYQNPPIIGSETYLQRFTVSFSMATTFHCGVVTLGDGRVLFVPHSYTYGVIYDPVTDSFSFTDIPLSSGFADGCLLPDGRVCLLPGINNYIYIWTPGTNNLFRSSVNLSKPGLSQPYNGGVLLKDGNIMLIPYERNDGTLIYNPVTDTVQEIMGAEFTTPNKKSFYSGQLSLDGSYVLLTPHNSLFALKVYTDPPYNLVFAGLGTTFGGNQDFSGSVMLSDGRIFFVPYNSTSAYLYNPNTDTFTIAGGGYPAGPSKYRSGILMPDGRVCMPPFGYQKVAFYDPMSDSTLFSTTIGSASFKYAGGTVLENGKVLIAPYNEQKALIISPVCQSGFSRAATTGMFFKETM